MSLLQLTTPSFPSSLQGEGIICLQWFLLTDLCQRPNFSWLCSVCVIFSWSCTILTYYEANLMIYSLAERQSQPNCMLWVVGNFHMTYFRLQHPDVATWPCFVQKVQLLSCGHVLCTNKLKKSSLNCMSGFTFWEDWSENSAYISLQLESILRKLPSFSIVKWSQGCLMFIWSN